jgi:hypothetical protein
MAADRDEELMLLGSQPGVSRGVLAEANKPPQGRAKGSQRLKIMAAERFVLHLLSHCSPNFGNAFAQTPSMKSHCSVFILCRKFRSNPNAMSSAALIQFNGSEFRRRFHAPRRLPKSKPEVDLLRYGKQKSVRSSRYFRGMQHA